MNHSIINFVVLLIKNKIIEFSLLKMLQYDMIL